MNDTAATHEPSPTSHADHLIHCRWLFSAAAGDELLEHQALVIRKQQIVDILPSDEARQSYTANEVWELDRHLVMPGLINAHGHAPMSLLRGYADDMPLQRWLQEKIWPAEAHWVSEDFVRDGTELAVAEMLLSGTTTFSDMYFFPDVVGRVAGEAGMRAQLAAPILEFPTIWARDAADYIHKATAVHDSFRSHPLVSTAFGPHAPYTVADETLEKVSQLADELDIPIHIHLHENPAEIEEAMSKGGQRPLARLAQLGLLTPHLQTAHMTQLLDEEIELLATHGVHVVHCPSSNLKLGSGICPLKTLLAAGVNVCLGTDGAASNNSLDMLQELQLAALLAKGFSADAAAVPATTALRMATAHGARALGLEDICGSLEVGKAADISAFRLDTLNSLPVYSPSAALVYSGRASQVSHVWVAGRLCVRDGELQTLDTERITERAQHWATTIGHSL